MWNGDNGYETWKINNKCVRGKGMPIMEDIMSAWIKFKNKFYEWGNNINI